MEVSWVIGVPPNPHFHGFSMKYPSWNRGTPILGNHHIRKFDGENGKYLWNICGNMLKYGFQQPCKSLFFGKPWMLAPDPTYARSFERLCKEVSPKPMATNWIDHWNIAKPSRFGNINVPDVFINTRPVPQARPWWTHPQRARSSSPGRSAIKGSKKKTNDQNSGAAPWMDLSTPTWRWWNENIYGKKY